MTVLSKPRRSGCDTGGPSCSVQLMTKHSAVKPPTHIHEPGIHRQRGRTAHLPPFDVQPPGRDMRQATRHLRRHAGDELAVAEAGELLAGQADPQRVVAGA
jgi:hypothetical protein